MWWFSACCIFDVPFDHDMAYVVCTLQFPLFISHTILAVSENTSCIFIAGFFSWCLCSWWYSTCDSTFWNESHWYFFCVILRYLYYSREHKIHLKMMQMLLKLGYCYYNNLKSQNWGLVIITMWSQPPQHLILRNWQTKFSLYSPQQQAGVCLKHLLMTFTNIFCA